MNWSDNIGQVAVQTNGRKLKAHPSYTAAKAGDASAAFDVVWDVIDCSKVRELGRRHPDAIIVAVMAQERSGRNALPWALAGVISAITGIEADPDIVQSNKVGHTGASMATRFSNRAEFQGTVQQGRSYILVDDFVTSGATIADMADFVTANGGKVVAVSSLAASYGRAYGSSANLAMPEDMALRLEAKYGKNELNEFLQSNNIRYVRSLSRIEGQWLLSFGSLESVRNRIAQEPCRGDFGADQGGGERTDHCGRFTQELPQEHFGLIESDPGIRLEWDGRRGILSVSGNGFIALEFVDGGVITTGDIELEVDSIAGDLTSLAASRVSAVRVEGCVRTLDESRIEVFEAKLAKDNGFSGGIHVGNVQGAVTGERVSVGMETLSSALLERVIRRAGQFPVDRIATRKALHA